MSDDPNTDENEDAVRAALDHVDRLSAEGEATDGLDPDAVVVLKPTEAPPSGDPSGEGSSPDLHLEEEFAGRGEASLEGEATSGAEEVLITDEEDLARPKKDARDAMLEAMIKAKNEAVSALEQTQKEAKSLQDRLLRVSADFENFKKRQNREKEDAVRYANERLLKELLPVLDNADRAMAVVEKAAADGESVALKSVVDGVHMVLSQLISTLGRFGIEPFSALGQTFDPAKHEAVAQREDASVPAGNVIEEYQKGYALHGRLIRPAMVVVASGGPPPGANGHDEKASGAADEGDASE